MLEATFSKIIRDDFIHTLSKPEEYDEDGRIAKPRRRPHVELVRDSYNSGKKPYDFYVVYHKVFCAIELKVVKGKSINLELVSSHQIESLYEVEHCGPIAGGFVVLYVPDYDDKLAIVIPVYSWKKTLKENKGVTSIKIEDYMARYEGMYTEMRREKGEDNRLHWDIRKITGYEKY